MRRSKFLFNLIIIFCLLSKVSPNSPESTNISPSSETKGTASWTMLVYIAADNNLASYASYNINDMAAGLTSLSGVNILVQWDKPSDNKTWRYKITPGGKIDAGSFTSEMGYNPAKEMGYNPAKELVDAMDWAIKNYPANNYALILWDHGSGIEDFYPGSRNILNSYKLLNLLPSVPERGILYDESQDTCLTNQGLTSALTQIKQLLGKNLDLIAMDACLMAMVEVTYQMKGLVNIFVGSQQTIPGYGFPYSQFITPLSLNPSGIYSLQLAQSMVSSYKKFYTSQISTPDFTLSAINVASIDLIKQNIDQFVTAVASCSKVDKTKTKNIILAARKASLSFEMPEYIDLYSFYANILNKTKKTSPKSSLVLEKKNKKANSTISKDYQKTLDILNTVIQDGLNKISTVVLQKTAGPVYSGAKGISIYYPSSGQIDSSYGKTLFAQNTAWIQFIKTYR